MHILFNVSFIRFDIFLLGGAGIYVVSLIKSCTSWVGGKKPSPSKINSKILQDFFYPPKTLVIHGVK